MAHLLSFQPSPARQFPPQHQNAQRHALIFTPFRYAHLREHAPEKYGSLQMIKRIREFLCQVDFADTWPEEIAQALSEVRRQFLLALKKMPYRQLVQEGYVNRMLDDYLGLLMISREKHGDCSYITYTDEREYYYHHPQEVQAVALQLKYLVIQ